MAVKDGRKHGNATAEIYAVDPRIISIRLIDGSYLGPQLSIGENGKYELMEGEEPLAYTPAVIERIFQDSWNARKDYGDLEQLKAEIRAAGRIKEPLKLFVDGRYLGAEEAHRRHRALWELRQEGLAIDKVPATIIKIGASVSFEDLEINFWTGNQKKPLNFHEKKLLIERHINRGISKEQFAEQVGCDIAEIDIIYTIAAQPLCVRQMIDSGEIAPTTLKSALAEARRLDWTSAEITEVLQSVVTEAKDIGKKKATQEMVLDGIEKAVVKTRTKKPVQLDIYGNPSVKKRLTARTKAKTFESFLSQVEKTEVTEEAVSLKIPRELWNECEEVLASLSKKRKNKNDLQSANGVSKT